jgi:hypothetical protein
MSKNIFDEQNYLLLKNFFNLKDVTRMSKRMHHLRNSGMLFIDEQCPNSYSACGDPIHSEYQELYREKLEKAIGYELYPTYSYARIYSPKEVLEKHKDRSSCEISITSTLDYNTFDDEPWDLYFEPNIKIKLYPGDVLVYKGCEIEHWREKFIGVIQTQIFMHYVNKNGKYHDRKYDGRPSLGASMLLRKNFDEEVCGNGALM